MEPKRTGTVGESVVICEFAKRGIPIYLPFGDNEKIDLLADFNHTFNRIQIKTVTEHNGEVYTVDLRSCKNHKTVPETYHYTKEDIDYYAVVCLSRNSVCLIPVEDAPSSDITIRFGGEPKNKQKKFIRYEKDYLIDNFIKND